MAIAQTQDLERALQLAADQHASDLYLLPGEPLCLRVKGTIHRMETPILSGEQVRTIALTAVGKDRLSTLNTESGRAITSCAIPGVVAGQMCISSSRGEYSIAIRIIPSLILLPDRLAVPQAFLDAARSPSGLLLFTGIPGSGKTTTLYAILEDINRRACKHICTIEDPINAMFTPKSCIIQQREIGVDVPDVITGIAAAMRQDADVIFIGDVNTPEEVQATIAAAQMQHLVMTQLNTARTPEAAIQRLIEVQPPDRLPVVRRQLSRVLRAAIGQVLLPRADGHGLIAAYGVLIPDDDLRHAIAEGQDPSDWPHPLPPGCQTLPDDITRLQREGLIPQAAADEALQSVRASG